MPSFLEKKASVTSAVCLVKKQRIFSSHWQILRLLSRLAAMNREQETESLLAAISDEFNILTAARSPG